MNTIAGDQGLAGKAELRYDISGYFGQNLSPLVRQISLFGFYDTGKVWSDYSDSFSLASTDWSLRGTLDATPLQSINKRALDFEMFMAWKEHAPDYVNDNSPVIRARLILNF